MLEHHDVRLRLCAITDDLRDGATGLVARALAAEQGGATMLLLRLKHADAMTLVEVGRQLVAALRIPVIVSERLDVALACRAAGLHLSSSSMPVVAIRTQVTAPFLIGGSVTTAADLESASAADYITIGPVFGPAPETMGVAGFRRLAAACGRPAIAIGGVDAATRAQLIEAGASGIAVIRAVFGASDPMMAAQHLMADGSGAGEHDNAPDHME